MDSSLILHTFFNMANKKSRPLKKGLKKPVIRSGRVKKSQKKTIGKTKQPLKKIKSKITAKKTVKSGKIKKNLKKAENQKGTKILVSPG